MATTRAEIQKWFDEGVKRGAKWMVIRVDTWDYDDYPSYYAERSTVQEVVANPGKMQRVMEIYDLTAERAPQLNAQRVWALNDNDPAVVNPKRSRLAVKPKKVSPRKGTEYLDANGNLLSSPVKLTPKPPTKKTKAQLQAELNALQAEVAMLRGDMQRIANASNEFAKHIQTLPQR